MERKRWSNIFFINAIKGNMVKKIRNVDVCRKQALKFKTVKEILEAQDVKKLRQSTSQAAQSLDLSSSCARFGTESYYLPHVERCFENFASRETESVHCGADDESSDDLDDEYGEITLKQLKEKYKTKKRKLVNSIDIKKRPKLEPEEDDSDLREPLSSLRLKFTKAKQKHTQATLESEEYTDHKMQLHGDLALILHIKTEVPDPVITECQLKIPSVDDFPYIGQGAEASISRSITGRTQKMLECQSNESILFTEQYPSCSLNKVSYDHLQHVEPNSPSIPTCEDTMDVDGQEETCQQFPDLLASECEIETSEELPLLITLPTKDENLYTNNFSRSTSHIDKFLEQESGNQAVLASSLEVDGRVSDKHPCHGNESLTSIDDTKKDLGSNQQIDDTSSPASTFSIYWEHPLCLSTNENLLCGGTEQQQPLSCSSPDGRKSPAKPVNHLVSLEGKLSLDEHEGNKTSVHVCEEKEERYSSSKNKSCNIDETLSTSMLVQPPERLLLTRKVISPSSEERLCLAMNSSESYIKENCKENPSLSLSYQSENNASSVGSDFKHANKNGNPKGSGITNRTKVIIKPAKTAKRSKHGRRNSPPKGNLEGPRLCRSLPNVSTGCTSLQGCSESAIAFSQRQMHDIESLAVKLVSELKYMKEIVEEKLLFEGYRNASIKNDADEVKDAITNAVKVEETTRKWLSMMSRDCNRFCKIMSLTQKGTDPATSKNGIQRERRKITFADEAGGILCHVKVFGNEMPLESDSEK